MRVRFVVAMLSGLALWASVATAQERPLSPRGQATTQIGSNWIDIHYGRPILRARQGIFGEGDEYGQQIYAGAPIWRIGADVTTRITTEMDLVFGDDTLPAGEYSMFADLTANEWTLVFSTLGPKQTFREETPNTVWGAYGYTDDLDVLRTSMTVSEHPVSADQLIVTFTDVTEAGGNLTIWWDNQIATTPFEVAE